MEIEKVQLIQLNSAQHKKKQQWSDSGCFKLGFLLLKKYPLIVRKQETRIKQTKTIKLRVVLSHHHHVWQTYF